MEKPRYFTEIVWMIISAVWFHFAATNISTTLGNIYSGFAATSLALLIITGLIYDKNVSITFKKSNGSIIKSMFIGAGLWVVLLITSVFVLKFISPAQANFNSVLSLLGATTPAFANSKIANFLTFAIFVPIVETQLWSRGLEFIADIFNIPVNKKFLKKLLLIILILSLMFLAFHSTAKGVENISSLAIVGLMMFISLMSVVFTEETLPAIFLHIFSNSAATLIMLLSSGSLVLG